MNSRTLLPHTIVMRHMYLSVFRQSDSDSQCLKRSNEASVMQSDSEIISAHHQTNDDGDKGESEALLQASTGPERPFKRRRVQGGMFTSRSSQDLPDASDLDDRIRLRFKHNRPHIIPCFTGCPAWSKQLMYVEYQVGSSFAPPSHHSTPYIQASRIWLKL